MGTGVGLICASRRHFTPKYPEWSFAMRPANTLLTRREFLQASAVATISAPVPASDGLTQVAPQQPNDDVLPAWQKERRKELWGLLGDLPWGHKPGPAKLVSKEEHEDYVLERLVLDLNGVEPVPALLLIPRKRQTPAPGLLYIHWHGGMYDLGKEMLLKGVQVAPAYAPVCADKGLVTLAIDSWCFGERKHEKDGHEGEENAFKLMLWKGQVLYGMMMFDEFRAMDYLASRPEVDDQRLGDRKSTRLNSSHITISYAVFCLKKKTKNNHRST